MELKITDAVAELGVFTTTLKDYHAEMAAYLADPIQTPPSFVNFSVNTLNTLTTALLTQGMSANAISGYLVDAVHHMNATQRELGIRYASKSSYYLSGADDATNESQYYDGMNAEYAQAYKGKIL